VDKGGRCSEEMTGGGVRQEVVVVVGGVMDGEALCFARQKL